MNDIPRIDRWTVDVDAADEPILTGTVDGAEIRTLPVAQLDPDAGIARLADGTMLQLGTPARPVDPANPLAPPPAARQRRLERALEAARRVQRGDGPTPAELAAAPRLDAWCVDGTGRYAVLTGIVTGHPRLVDGSAIRTSALLWLAEDGTAARTVSRWYALGEPLEALLRQPPN
ncbi:MAG: DUF6634 family protein [Pseudomonadota bacterium]